MQNNKHAPSPIRVFQRYDQLPKMGGIEKILTTWYKTSNKNLFSYDFGITSPRLLDTDFATFVRQQGNTFLTARSASTPWGRFSYLFRLYKTLKTGKYAVFQKHISSALSLFFDSGVVFFSGIKNRYILTHSPLILPFPHSSFYIWLVRWIIKKTYTRCFAVSELAGKNVYGSKIPFTVVSPGIEVDKFVFNEELRLQTRKKLGMENNFIVGAVGRLAPEKNHAFLLDIFKEIHTQNPSARLIIVGDGPLKNALLQKARQLGLEKEVLFTGEVTNPACYYQAFDTFIFPSSYESVGLVALEAQTSGLPCILSDTLPSEICVCNTAMLSLSEKPSVWAQKALTLSRNFSRKDQSSRMKQAGWDISHFTQKMEQLYSH